MASTGEPIRPPRTAAQIALSEERKTRRLIQAQHPQAKTTSQLLERPWLPLRTLPFRLDLDMKIKIMTWNILAQTLVRRELFPTSDCLRASQREPLLYDEILRLDADILCLQEVDRLDRLISAIQPAGFSFSYASGPNKKHGCLICYKTSMFSLQEEKVIFYDDEEIRSDLDGAGRRGRSFNTRNIGFISGLQRKDDQSKGVVIATTHLFWHPKYTYERTRQAGILMREVAKFRDGGNPTRHSWPCIIAGDFNFAPDDPAYSLLVGDRLLPEQEKRLSASCVVHRSVDPNIPTTTDRFTNDPNEDEEAEVVDPDRVITNARPAQVIDGLLSIHELVSFYSPNPPLRSAYDTDISHFQSTRARKLRPYGSKVSALSGRRGYNEPEFTSYTHYWKTPLDYIFIMSPDEEHLQISSLLSPLTASELEPGLPQKSICGSDHLPLAAELTLFK